MTDESAPSLLIDIVLRRLRQDLLGEGEDNAVVDQDFPHNLFPAGNLGPAQVANEPTDDFRATEFSPSAMGAILQVDPDCPSSLHLEGRFNVFLPQAPTVETLRRQATRYEEPSLRSFDWAALTPEQLALLRTLSIKYRPVYLRRTVEFSADIPVGSLSIDNAHHGISPATEAIRKALSEIASEAAQASPLLARDGATRIPDEIPGEVLLDAASLSRELAKFSTPVMPSWQIEVEVLYRAWRRPGSPALLVEVLLANRTPTDAAIKLAKSGVECHLFSPELSIAIDHASALPFNLKAIQEKDYRNDPTVFASGVNCDLEEREFGKELVVWTDTLPVFRQHRLESTRLAEYPTGAPTFEQLDEAPLEHLRRVAKAMHRYADWWESAYDDLVAKGQVPQGVNREFLAAAADFRQDLERFESAVRLISEPGRTDLLLAFRLTNRSLAAQQRPSLRGWRLFQLVFLVSSLTEFLHRESPGGSVYPAPSVLAFPTGGGKTEAYLGLILTHAFWDRLRGKSFGLTAWCKFPLRLLGMQQLSRFVTAFAHADVIRQRAPEIPDVRRGDPFGVGLFAGGENSTNDTDFPNDASRRTNYSRELDNLPSLPPGQDHPLLRKNRKIDRCPLCVSRGYAQSGRIEVRFEPRRPGFVHFCTQCGNEPPLYVTDTEVRRFLPTVVIGTIDKLAELGRDASTKILFGFARSKCQDHGYFEQSPGQCQVLSCNQTTVDVSGTPDLGPGLLIQDELHLLRETLGAFDSHYETTSLAIMDEAQRLLPRHGGRWKIVGSSATIVGFDEQIRELYSLKGARRFPSPGPARGLSFYATENSEEVQRHIVGFRPHNMSHVDAVMKVLLSYHRIILPLANHDPVAWSALGEPFASMPLADREVIIRHYRTSLCYAMTRMESAQVNRSFTGQLNPTLGREGLPTFEDSRVVNLTSESGAEGIQQVLHKLETPPRDWIQALTSTSIVGHGVDIDVLNFIVFRGQPHTVAEWLQAMARVGRKPAYPSIVVNVYNPNRERDATYYRHHKKFIQHADSLLRTVPITRFSCSALRKTFPGLFYNSISFFIAPPGFMFDLRDQLKRSMPRFRQPSEELLRRYYALPATSLSPKETRLLEALHDEIESTLQILNNPTMPKRTVDALRPMISLRDVDEIVSISPDYDFERFR